MEMFELGSISKSKNVQSLRRLSILSNCGLVFFFRCQKPFCLKNISNSAGGAMFVKYFVLFV